MNGGAPDTKRSAGSMVVWVESPHSYGKAILSEIPLRTPLMMKAHPPARRVLWGEGLGMNGAGPLRRR